MIGYLNIQFEVHNLASLNFTVFLFNSLILEQLGTLYYY